MVRGVSLFLRSSSGSYGTESKVLSFTFKKEAYTPYTTLTVKAVSTIDFLENAAEVKLDIDGRTVHHGIVDKLTAETMGRKSIITITSRGFTSLLTQNQIAPGLRSGISINSLMDSFYTLPNVTHESSSDTSSYIYVSPHSTMWDGVANLSYKLYGTYPYIRGTNRVTMLPPSEPSVFTYDSDELLTLGQTLNTKRLASHFHMENMSGSYDEYQLIDREVLNRKIVRHQFFELDKRFLYSPDDALIYRDKFCTRGYRERFCVYSGYNGEDLYDTVSFSGVSRKPIKAIEISGDNTGVKTKLSVYYDKF